MTGDQALEVVFVSSVITRECALLEVGLAEMAPIAQRYYKSEDCV